MMGRVRAFSVGGSGTGMGSGSIGLGALGGKALATSQNTANSQLNRSARTVACAFASVDEACS